MADLITCRTCGAEVSSNAKMCPHCGERTPEPYLDRFNYSLIGIAALIVLISLGLGALLLINWMM